LFISSPRDGAQEGFGIADHRSGQVYEVSWDSGQGIYGSYVLEGDATRTYWCKARFEDVVETVARKKVRCIRATDSMKKLTVDQVYEVDHEGVHTYTNQKQYYLVGIYADHKAAVLVGWFADRFVVIDEERPTLPSLPKSDKVVDVEEERLWRIMKAVEPGRCACNVVRELCWIHRKP
jgi:hypothetical protein